MKTVTLNLYVMDLEYQNSGEHDYRIFKSVDEYRDFLYKYAVDNWDSEFEDDPMPESRDELIEHYFDNAPLAWHCELCRVEYTTNELHDLIGEAVAGR